MSLHANLYYVRGCLLPHECSLLFVIIPFCHLLSIYWRFILLSLWIMGLAGCLITLMVVSIPILYCSCMRWITWNSRIPALTKSCHYTLQATQHYSPPGGTTHADHTWTFHSTQSTTQTLTYSKAHFFSNIFVRHHHMQRCSISSLWLATLLSMRYVASIAIRRHHVFLWRRVITLTSIVGHRFQWNFDIVVVLFVVIFDFIPLQQWCSYYHFIVTHL